MKSMLVFVVLFLLWTCSASPTERCSHPPSVHDGDFLETFQERYIPGDKVTYKCQKHYLMRGPSEVRCENGAWTETPICIAPCTITEELMDQNHIELKWSSQRKLYAASGNFVEFACRRGYQPDPSSREFRTICNEGNLEYPTCIQSQEKQLTALRGRMKPVFHRE